MLETLKRCAHALFVVGVIGVASRANAELKIVGFGDQRWLALQTGRLLPTGAPRIGQTSPFDAAFQHAPILNPGSANFLSQMMGMGGIGSLGTITYSVHNPLIEFSFWNGTAPAATNLVSIQGDLRGSLGQRETLLALNLAGQVVASSTVFGRYGQSYTISSPSADIHSIKLVGVDVANQFLGPTLDDPPLGQPTVVPEPSTLVLGGMACLVGLAGAYRRRLRNLPFANRD